MRVKVFLVLARIRVELRWRQPCIDFGYRLSQTRDTPLYL
jgi:hypothetical protein